MYRYGKISKIDSVKKPRYRAVVSSFYVNKEAKEYTYKYNVYIYILICFYLNKETLEG